MKQRVASLVHRKRRGEPLGKELLEPVDIACHGAFKHC